MGTVAQRCEGMAEKITGKIKHAIGRILGSEKIEAEGKAKELQGEAREEAVKTSERVKGKGEEVAGAAKERVGAAIDSERTQAEGKATELQGEARQKAT
jgi:uncharacterized protein YjbJ (UPF0337 family)